MYPVDELTQRDQHLAAIARWIAVHGLPALSLERAAAAAGVPTDEFCEFFDSKEELIAALLARSRQRHREMFFKVVQDSALNNTERRRIMWQHYVTHEDDLRLFFEAYGLALHDELYGPFISGIEDWMGLMKDTLESQGVLPGVADAYATLVIAVYRGAMLDYCATGNRARVNAAMELWFKAADLLEKAG